MSKGADLKLSKDIVVVLLASHCLYQSMYSLGILAFLRLCKSRLTITLGKVALTSRNRTETKLSLDAHASVTNLVSRCSESVVERPGLPPKCVDGRRLFCSAIYVRSSATHNDRILAMVSRSVIGLYAFGRL